jgi:putative NADH-flavin reductase
MNLLWIGRNRSLEVSPRARLVDDVDAAVLQQKREALQWRPANGFLKDEQDQRLTYEEPQERAA